MKVFFATDIHGSEICWRKFLNAAAFYKADMVILGGDVTGKVLVPILAMPGYWEVTFTIAQAPAAGPDGGTDAAPAAPISDTAVLKICVPD